MVLGKIHYLASTDLQLAIILLVNSCTHHKPTLAEA